MLPVVAGEAVEIQVTCVNDEQKVVTFTAQVIGLGSWPSPVRPLPVVPFESGSLSLTIVPGSEAQEGDYPFTVQLLCNGDPVEGNGALALVLRVSGAALPIAQSEPEPVVEATRPAVEPPVKAPKVKKTVTVSERVSTGEPVADDLPAESAASTVTEPEAQVRSAEPVTTVEPDPVDEVAATPLPEPVVEPEPIPQPIPKPKPPPEPKPEPRVVMFERKPEPEPEAEETDPTLAYASDQVLANPPEGTTLYVKPGETLLVRFNINNDQSGVRTYVLQEDRSLPSNWIALVRDQVNITPGGSGDVAFALKPPMNADPATYPFTVSYGVLGKPLTPCYLTLAVQATPATRMEVKKAAVSVGPIGRNVPFDLTIESAGNSDTGYRISVVQEAPDDSGEPGLVEVYETPTWTYLFDKEFENLVSPTAGRPPPPVPHRINIARKGIWWLGWRESHKVKLRSIPVTDVTNGGKGGNTVELVASRWRILPMPWFISLPLIYILVILLGSGASDFRITNALSGEDGAYYVVGTQPEQNKLDVHLAWTAPFYSALKLNKIDQGHATPVNKSGDKATDSAGVLEYGQAQRVSYEIGSRFFGTPEKADLRLVPVKSEDQLSVNLAGARIAGSEGKDTIGEEHVPVTTREMTVMVPRSGSISLSFANRTGVGKVNGQQIVMWTVHYPSGFNISNFLFGNGDNQVINPASLVTARIEVNSSTPPTDGEATWEMVTTDGSNQLLRIKLKVTG